MAGGRRGTVEPGWAGLVRAVQPHTVGVVVTSLRQEETSCFFSKVTKITINVILYIHVQDMCLKLHVHGCICYIIGCMHVRIVTFLILKWYKICAVPYNLLAHYVAP